MSTVQISDESELITDAQQPKFKKISTLPAAVVQIILCVCQIILVFGLPVLCDRENTKDGQCALNSFSLLIYTHGGHWAFFLVIDQFLHNQHHRSRLNGYLEFYLKTKNIRRAPFYILSAGNAILMIVVMILYDFCNDNNNECSSTLTKVDYLRGLITLESLVIICLVSTYMIWVTDFHKKQLPPDVLRDDVTSTIMLSGANVETIGCLEQDQLQDVLERQADMIRYLHEHSELLGRKILVLTNQLSNQMPYRT